MSLVSVKKDDLRKNSTIIKEKVEEEPELRQEFIEKIKKRDKQKPIKYDFLITIFFILNGV
jgi:hypothetical protein